MVRRMVRVGVHPVMAEWHFSRSADVRAKCAYCLQSSLLHSARAQNWCASVVQLGARAAMVPCASIQVAEITGFSELAQL